MKNLTIPSSFEVLEKTLPSLNPSTSTTSSSSFTKASNRNLADSFSPPTTELKELTPISPLLPPPSYPFSVSSSKSFQTGPSCRNWCRFKLLSVLTIETEFILKLQTHRSWILDLVLTRLGFVGTHTAYLIFLPWFKWLSSGIILTLPSTSTSNSFYSIHSYANHDEKLDLLWIFGRNLISLLAWAVFTSGCIKDWLGLPRPPCPPVIRLSETEEGSHLEYGKF